MAEQLPIPLSDSLLSHDIWEAEAPSDEADPGWYLQTSSETARSGREWRRRKRAFIEHHLGGEGVDIGRRHCRQRASIGRRRDRRNAYTSCRRRLKALLLAIIVGVKVPHRRTSIPDGVATLCISSVGRCSGVA